VRENWTVRSYKMTDVKSFNVEKAIIFCDRRADVKKLKLEAIVVPQWR
jgi:hypothetical protein